MKHAYRLGATEWKALASIQGASLMLAEIEPLKASPHGTQGVACLVGLQKARDETLVIHNEEITALPVTYPGIAVSRLVDYAGDWTTRTPALRPLEQSLGPVLTGDRPLEVLSVSVVRDEMSWRSRADGSEVHLTTDVGLLFTCTYELRVLLLALNSIASFLQVAVIPSDVRLDWWLSDTAVRKTWILDYSPEGPEFLHTHRRLV